MMAYSIYNKEGSGSYTLIHDQSSTMVNMAQWMRQAKDNQFLEYPLNEDGTPTGEELHSINGFTEADSFVDDITYARPMRDTIFNERRSFGLHIFSPFNFETGDPAKPWLEVAKKAGNGVSATDEWAFTVKYTAGAPTGFTAKKNDADCTNQVTETGSGLKFRLKAGETIRIDFDADSSFRCEVTEDDSSKLTSITGTGGVADMTAKKFTSTSGIAKTTFTNGTEPPRLHPLILNPLPVRQSCSNGMPIPTRASAPLPSSFPLLPMVSMSSTPTPPVSWRPFSGGTPQKRRASTSSPVSMPFPSSYRPPITCPPPRSSKSSWSWTRTAIPSLPGLWSFRIWPRSD